MSVTPRKVTLSKESREFYDTIVGYLRINPDELENEMARHGVTYAFLAASQADAKLKQEHAKLYYDRIKADRYFFAKISTYTNPASGKNSVYTEDMAKASAQLDDDVWAAKEELIEAEYHLSLWDSIMTVMEHRSYMLSKIADLRYVDRRLEAEVFNGQAREDVAQSMNNMANMDAKRQANMQKRKAQLESIRRNDDEVDAP